MSVESLLSLSPQQNRRLSNPLSDDETGLVNARSRLCFGFIKLVFVLEHSKTEDIGRPSLVRHPYPLLSLSSDLTTHWSVLTCYSGPY